MDFVERSDRTTLFASLLFVIGLTVSLYFENYYLAALPLALAIVYVAIFRPDLLLYLVAFSTPFSLNMEELGLGGIAFYMPTEPLLLGFTLIIFLAQLRRPVIPAKLLLHPISVAMALWLGWIFITSLMSEDPIVSLKYMLSRLWFIVPIYFFGGTLFMQRHAAIRFLLSFASGLVVVVAITSVKHFLRGFDEESAHWIMEPLFRDHTQYAAVISIFIPLLLGAALVKKISVPWRLIALACTGLLLLALVYTYSRAAWLSVVLAIGLWLAVRLKISTRLIMGGALVIAALIAVSMEDILLELRKNQTDSSDDLIENVESITNISTDASNLERINRWNAVFAMAKEKPLFGFGPGMYMFEYAPYQSSNDLTVISTNFGDIGNAHSEYLGPLAEMGIPGFLLTLYLVFTIFWTAFRCFHRMPANTQRDLLLYSTLGLVTYFAHGVLNNFLDADKASVPVYGLIAIVVAIDLTRGDDQKSIA